MLANAMSVSNPQRPPRRNSLNGLASVGGVLLGVFLLAGAFGHFASVWSTTDGQFGISSAPPFPLLFPGLLLLLSGSINICLCRALWTGARWALHSALAVNLLTAVYLGYLLDQGVPGHPIGLFLALVSSQILLLAAIRSGLIWPAMDQPNL